MANFYLLSVTGLKMPADLREDAEKTVRSKADVISWLKRWLEAVKEAHLAERAEDLQRKALPEKDQSIQARFIDRPHKGTGKT